MKNKICIVISTYNEDITQELLKSAKKELNKFGNNKIDIISKKIAFLFCNENKYSIFNFTKEKFNTLL